MTQQVRSYPTIRVYCHDDRRSYAFMELAAVDPGHYVAWGEIIRIDQEEARLRAFEIVMQSLENFESRDGNDKSRRMNAKKCPPFQDSYDLASVRLVQSRTLEVIPHRRTANGYQRLDDLAVTRTLPLAPAEFIALLNLVFSKGRG